MITQFLRKICGHGKVDHTKFSTANMGSAGVWKKRQTDVMPIRRYEINRYLNNNWTSTLDVGAGDGVFSDLVRAHKIETECVEVCEQDVAKLKAKGYKVYGSFGETDKQYDLVHANHVIEHVDDPNNFLRGMYKCTKPGGVVFIGFPCEWSILLLAVLARILSLGMYDPSFYLNKWHVNYWTAGQMCKLLEKSGFEVLTVWRDKWTLPTAQPTWRDILHVIFDLKHANIIARRPI